MKPDITPEPGKILLSEPLLPDPNFKRSVILLTEHNKDGTVGFILNKKSDIKLNEAIPDFPDLDIPVYIGGPVQTNTLHFLHRYGNKLEGSIKIADDVYWSGNFEVLRILITSKQITPEDIRFFIGYSGWIPNQLDYEISENSWILTNAKPEFVFPENPEKLWTIILKSMGKKYAILTNFPEDPSLN